MSAKLSSAGRVTCDSKLLICVSMLQYSIPTMHFLNPIPINTQSKPYKPGKSRTVHIGILSESPHHDQCSFNSASTSSTLWTGSVLAHSCWLVTNLRNMLLICFLMKALRPRNFPYILCRQVFRKSLSLGSSLSNKSNSWNINPQTLQIWSSSFSIFLSMKPQLKGFLVLGLQLRVPQPQPMWSSKTLT